ncbi:DUF4214 domain-containing protein [Halarcobacter sp.]|uniref:DUF4214 domain-containing protein n=1 Tax=Halarcobacter sp. TaxID=2321133 RepID=UPI002AA7EF97|nr:DUF4214 domain-containing protein [Halarcobacter sp.]
MINYNYSSTGKLLKRSENIIGFDPYYIENYIYGNGNLLKKTINYNGVNYDLEVYTYDSNNKLIKEVIDYRNKKYSVQKLFNCTYYNRDIIYYAGMKIKEDFNLSQCPSSNAIFTFFDNSYLKEITKGDISVKFNNFGKDDHIVYDSYPTKLSLNSSILQQNYDVGLLKSYEDTEYLYEYLYNSLNQITNRKVTIKSSSDVYEEVYTYNNISGESKLSKIEAFKTISSVKSKYFQKEYFYINGEYLKIVKTDFENPTNNSRIEYTRDGNNVLLQRLSYRYDDSIYYKVVYNEGKPVLDIYYNSNGEINRKIRMAYNSFGQMIKKEISSGDTITSLEKWYYDNNQNLIEHYFDDNNTDRLYIYKYLYDDNGNKIFTYYDDKADGSFDNVYSYNYNNQVSYALKNNNNSEIYPTYIISIDQNTQKPVLIQTMFYDEQNRLVLTNSYNSDYRFTGYVKLAYDNLNRVIYKETGNEKYYTTYFDNNRIKEEKVISSSSSSKKSIYNYSNDWLTVVIDVDENIDGTVDYVVEKKLNANGDEIEELIFTQQIYTSINKTFMINEYDSNYNLVKKSYLSRVYNENDLTTPITTHEFILERYVYSNNRISEVYYAGDSDIYTGEQFFDKTSYIYDSLPRTIRQEVDEEDDGSIEKITYIYYNSDNKYINDYNINFYLNKDINNDGLITWDDIPSVELMPELSLSATSLKFINTQQVNTESDKLSIDISNTGDFLLSGMKISLDNNQFRIVNGCYSNIEVNENCSLDVYFKPSSEGNKFGTITISFDNFPNKIITIEGNAIVNTTSNTSTKKQTFIERFYQNILNRSADTGGMNTWLDVIQNQSAAKVALGFFQSQEFINLGLSNEEFVDILYQTLFDRVADSGGRDIWLNQLNNGTSRIEVIYGFLNAQEFKNLADSFGVTQIRDIDQITEVPGYVNRFYNLVLNRSADEVGFNDWVSQLRAGTKAGGDIAKGFFNSQEYMQRGLDDSTFLDICYRAFFNREADAGGKNSWLSQIAQGATTDDILNGFIGSQEFIQLAASYGINP